MVLTDFIRCFNCDAFAAFSSDFRTIKDSHHVIIDPAFQDRTRVETHPRPFKIDDISKDGKIYCAQCGYDWGITATYKRAKFPIVKLVSFILVDGRDKRNTVKKWKDAPFSVEPLTLEDISACLNSDKID